MSIENCPQSNILQIEHKIHSIDIKGQYVHLAAPIYLSGQMDIASLWSDIQINRQQVSDGVSLQIGIDEAGRGPLLGSVNVAATILRNSWSGLIEEQPLQNTPLAMLTDSKKLSEKKRDILYPLVQQHALGYIVADVPAAVIDQVNILQATMLGMRLCAESLLEAIASQFSNFIDNINTENINTVKNAPIGIQAQILVDGNRCPELDYVKFAALGIEKSAIDCQAWIKGDARHTSIAAASVLAKVSRDKTMYALDAQHPEYGIAKHKGYPTRAHMEAIENHGVLSAHRRSFAPVRKALES